MDHLQYKWDKSPLTATSIRYGSVLALPLLSNLTKPPGACARIDTIPMERAGKTLARLKLSKSISTDELACIAWPEAVGATIARYSTAIALVRNKLVVEVEDVSWQQPLFQLESQILKRIAEVLGPGVVGDLEIRIARPRMPPQRATQLTAEVVAGTLDDADCIRDSVMRMVYKQSRRKATA